MNFCSRIGPVYHGRGVEYPLSTAYSILSLDSHNCRHVRQECSKRRPDGLELSLAVLGIGFGNSSTGNVDREVYL